MGRSGVKARHFFLFLHHEYVELKKRADERGITPKEAVKEAISG